MTPKIFSTMKEEQSKLDTQITTLEDRKAAIELELEQIRGNRKAIADFLLHYEPTGNGTAKPFVVNSNGNGKHTRNVYGPSQETMAYLKSIYPSWATPTQIRENLEASGMKKSPDLTVRLQKSGKIEAKKGDGNALLYRMAVNGSSLDGRE